VPERAAVVEMKGVLWSDWGKPAHIVDSLRRIGREPAFPLDCLGRRKDACAPILRLKKTETDGNASTESGRNQCFDPR
jgi:hypothetical protein